MGIERKKNIIQHPSIILIIGRRRYGKSALGFSILENFHNERKLATYAVSLPKEKHYLLPDWITPVETVEELPDNCVAMIDEGALKYHAYMWGAKETVVMDRMISVSGQRDQTFIFITHTMRKFAITLLLDVDILLCKNPSLLHSRLERSEVRKLVDKVAKEFNKLPRDEVKKNTYVISDDFDGFIRNKLPSFWSEELSKSYAGIPLENINKKQRDTGNMEEEGEKPEVILGGLKIWCKKEDKRKVLEVISKHSTIDGVLADENMHETGDKAHINFDLTHIIGGTKKKPVPTGRYRLTSPRFNIEKSIKELDTKKIPHVVDMETGKPIFAGGFEGVGFYPISQDDADFKVEVEEETRAEETEKEKDELEEFAEKIKL